jgi:hypothetical protein
MNMKDEIYTKLNMQDGDSKRLQNFKVRRARERGNITHYVTELGKFSNTRRMLVQWGSASLWTD